MSPEARVLLGLGWHVIGRELRALAEEELLALLLENLLRPRRHQVQAVLVDEHLGMLEPELPRLLRDVVEDLLAQLVIPGLPLDALELFPHFDAVHQARHVTTRLE